MGNSQPSLEPVSQANGFVNRGSPVQSWAPAPETSEQTQERALEETWKQVVGFEGYEVSNQGRVRRSRTGRILRGQQCGNRPYLKLHLGTQEQRGQRTIHSLVAEAFLGPRPEGANVDHINGDYRDNRAENLRYLSTSENKAAGAQLRPYRCRACGERGHSRRRCGAIRRAS